MYATLKKEKKKKKDAEARRHLRHVSLMRKARQREDAQGAQFSRLFQITGAQFFFCFQPTILLLIS